MDSSQNIIQAGIIESHRIEIVPTGKLVRVDCNPIACYNHAISNFQDYRNRIQGVQLIQIWTVCCVSWVYDWLIYFYIRFFTTITCQLAEQCGLILTLLMLLVYVLILIMPGISIANLILSGMYFLYYIVGLIIYCYNLKQLGHHQFTERMVHQKNAPPFQGFINQYFHIKDHIIQGFYLKSGKLLIFRQILQSHKQGHFMAYKQQQFLDGKYYYIKSVKMIAFHIAFMTCAILGTVISVLLFPAFHGL